MCGKYHFFAHNCTNQSNSVAAGFSILLILQFYEETLLHIIGNGTLMFPRFPGMQVLFMD